MNSHELSVDAEPDYSIHIKSNSTTILLSRSAAALIHTAYFFDYMFPQPSQQTIDITGFPQALPSG